MRSKEEIQKRLDNAKAILSRPHYELGIEGYHNIEKFMQNLQWEAITLEWVLETYATSR